MRGGACPNKREARRGDHDRMTTMQRRRRPRRRSVMTVSRYFNDPAKLAAPRNELERVKLAVDELGYVPNATARSLTRGRSAPIALVVADTAIPSSSPSAGAVGISRRPRSTSCSWATRTRPWGQASVSYLETVISRRVDGVHPRAHARKRHDLEVLRQRGVPTVLIDRRLPDYDLDVVRGDTFTGGRILTEHLVAEGFRDIASSAAPLGCAVARRSPRRLRTAMEQAGLAPEAFSDATTTSGGTSSARWSRLRAVVRRNRFPTR